MFYDELGRTSKKTVVAYFKSLSFHFLEATEENCKNVSHENKCASRESSPRPHEIEAEVQNTE